MTDLKIQNSKIEISTKSDEIYNITDDIESFLNEIGADNGSILIFAVGSTCGIITIEYEPGLRRDFPEMMSKIAPRGHYHHDATWGDGNGHSHLRSSLVGTSITIPVINGKLAIGTWQQIVFCEFDIRPRNRKVIFQFTGNLGG
ncbi:YjbQ family protein [bacterium]|nr:YjbQ family protein [bacterium]